MQGELFCRCLETGSQCCVRCDWTDEKAEKMAGRRAAWVRHVNAYVHPYMQFGSRRGFEIVRGRARFEIVRDDRTGRVEVFALSGEGRRTLLGEPARVFAAGAEEFPTSFSLAQAG
jgi:hypothetical protein